MVKRKKSATQKSYEKHKARLKEYREKKWRKDKNYAYSLGVVETVEKMRKKKRKK
ncbi:unnamed protein product [marine sediment metagenome]|uniref:Uncharacterized protein n=1 Tax=marine sediment metagenome TaxID=412755 RepID=X1FMF8_9ZZZZ